MTIVLVQKLHFGKAGIAAVQHDVQPPFRDCVAAVVRRRRDGIGLHRAVHARAVGADHIVALGAVVSLWSITVDFVWAAAGGVAIGAAVALVLALFIWRVDVVRLLPQTAMFYRMVGFDVNLRGLLFKDVKVTTETVDGIPDHAPGRLASTLGRYALVCERRYLGRAGRTLPYGHSLVALVTRPR